MAIARPRPHCLCDIETVPVRSTTVFSLTGRNSARAPPARVVSRAAAQRPVSSLYLRRIVSSSCIFLGQYETEQDFGHCEHPHPSRKWLRFRLKKAPLQVASQRGGHPDPNCREETGLPDGMERSKRQQEAQPKRSSEFRPVQATALRISSVTFLASPNSIMVLGRKNSSFSTPA